MNASLKNALLGLLALACVIGVTLLWQKENRIKELEAAAAVARAERDQFDQRIATAEERRAELEREVAEWRNRPAPVAAPVAVAGPAPRMEPMRAGRGGAAAGMERFMDSPEFQTAMLAQLRAGLDGRYAALFRRLNLPSDQLARLKHLLVDRQAVGMDALAAARAGGVLPGDPSAIRGAVEQAQAEIDASVRELLGEERFRQYDDFNRNATQYAIAEQLERRLGYTQTPLLPEQMEELVRILVASPGAAAPANNTLVAVSDSATGRPRDTAMFISAAPMGGAVVSGATVSFGPGAQTPITDEAIARAAEVLTAEQVGALREIQAEQQASSQMMSGLRNLRGEGFRLAVPAGGPGAPSP